MWRKCYQQYHKIHCVGATTIIGRYTIVLLCIYINVLSHKIPTTNKAGQFMLYLKHVKKSIGCYQHWHRRVFNLCNLTYVCVSLLLKLTTWTCSNSMNSSFDHSLSSNNIFSFCHCIQQNLWSLVNDLTFFVQG